MEYARVDASFELFRGAYGNRHVTTFSDYSEWLKQGDNLAKEDEAWLRDHLQEREEVSKIVRDVIDEWNLETVIEFGCGTGWLGQMLPPIASYLGIDANEGCIDLAISRNKRERSSYYPAQIRTFEVFMRDLVCAFSFLKHFGLHEWREVFEKFLSFGDFAVFTLQLTDGEDEEDGTEYHHVWIGPETLKEALKHHEILHTEVRWQDPNSDKRDVLFVVKRKDL